MRYPYPHNLIMEPWEELHPIGSLVADMDRYPFFTIETIASEPFLRDGDIFVFLEGRSSETPIHHLCSVPKEKAA